MSRHGIAGARVDAEHDLEIEIEQDEVLQRRTWQVQRAGWLAAAMVVIAAAAGLFGSGPLSPNHAQTENVKLEYERFARVEAETRIRFTVARPGNNVTIVLPRSYASAVQLQSLEPQPVSSRADLNGLTLRYESDTGGPFVAQITLEPEAPGLHRAGFVVDGAPVAITQMLWP